MKTCLSLGADVNAKFKIRQNKYMSCLGLAVLKNYTELVEIFLSHPDIQINKTTKISGYQESPLMLACPAGNSAIVSRLVQVDGLDINYQDEKGTTAAHVASIRGNTECVRVLAETGRVDWNIRDISGRTPLYWALNWGHSDVVDIIMAQPNIDYNVKTDAGEHLEDICQKKMRNKEEHLQDVLDHLLRFSGPRLRMIKRESRQVTTPASLQRLSRDSVLVTMITNNTEERKVTTLVDRLEGEITRQAMQVLLETRGESNKLEKDIEE